MSVEYPSPSGEPDPYRFGAPDPAGPPAFGAHYTRPTGRDILRASWRMLRADGSMLALPVLGFGAALVAFAVLFAPGLAIGLSRHSEPVVVVFAVLGAFAASGVGMFFNAALVAAASMRADGYPPTLGTALGAAGRHWRQILGWSALTTTVGAAIRAVEQRLGVLGLLVGFLGGVTWAIASFFVVPAMIVEGLGPIEALKRSSGVIRQSWGTSVRTTLRFGFLQVLAVLAPLVLFFVGFTLLLGGSTGSTAAGAVLLAVSVVAFLAVAVVSGAVVTYARTLIFRYATGRPVPGIDPALFAGAFRPRRGRRGR